MKFIKEDCLNFKCVIITLGVSLLIIMSVIALVLNLKNTPQPTLTIESICPSSAVYLCGATGRCIYPNQTCNHFEDCPDGLDETNCTCVPNIQFACSNGPCIYRNWTCDGVADCPSGDDEALPACRVCTEKEFKCLKENQCISKLQICDGKVDCNVDASDETNCVTIGIGTTPQQTIANVTYNGIYGNLICFDVWEDAFGDDLCRLAGLGNLMSSLSTVLSPTGGAGFLSFNSSSLADSTFELIECLSALALAVVCQPKGCGARRIANNYESIGQYILNGQWATPGAWPWHAVLESKELCGGSLIHPLWVLTAAHCVVAKPEYYNYTGTIQTSDLKVSFGVTNLFSDDPSDLARKVTGQVKAIYVHPDYNASLATNDVALVRLVRPVQESNYVGTVCLPGDVVPNVQAFKVCVSTGFGYTEENKISLVLRQTRLNVLPDAFCSQQIADPSWILQRTCIGTRPTVGFNNICSGDSGGPFVCADQRGFWTLIGVHSYVLGQSGSQAVKKCQLSFVQRVGYYLPWIRETIG